MNINWLLYKILISPASFNFGRREKEGIYEKSEMGVCMKIMRMWDIEGTEGSGFRSLGSRIWPNLIVGTPPRHTRTSATYIHTYSRRVVVGYSYSLPHPSLLPPASCLLLPASCFMPQPLPTHFLIMVSSGSGPVWPKWCHHTLHPIWRTVLERRFFINLKMIKIT